MPNRMHGQRLLRVLIREKAYGLLESLTDRLEVTPGHLIERLLQAAAEGQSPGSPRPKAPTAYVPVNGAHRTTTSVFLDNAHDCQLACDDELTVLVATTTEHLPESQIDRLAREPALRVLTEYCTRPERLHELLQRLRPTLLLVDVALARGDIEGFLIRIKQDCPHGKIIILSDSIEHDCSVDRVIQGVSGFITYNADPDTFVSAVKSVSEGGFWLPNSVTAKLITAAVTSVGDHTLEADEFSKSIPWSLLTERERDVAKLIADGLTNKGIASQLSVSEDTVKKHVKKIFAKLGLHRRSLVSRLLQ
jgi:DNA-binding NarL/FixJ family response regulator